MIASMTAFARRETHLPWGSLSWEIRSVNQRYLEPSFRLPESLRNQETTLRHRLKQKLARGKLDLTLKFYPTDDNQELVLNEPLLEKLVTSAEKVCSKMAKAAPLDPLKLLEWPGVIQASETDEEEVQAQVLALFDQALDDLQAHRLREGEALAAMLEERLVQITTHLQNAQAYLPAALEAWRTSVLEKAAKLQADVDPQRLEQEVVLLAQKQDVAEELDRLEAHVTEVRRALNSKGPVGRRLDFLMQEMNREANTLGSKAMNLDMTQVSVELKVLIEQMREQIQNIE
ncbi:YicC/YloC family endoribonuclease [Marinospirillum sp.]|uniref:YicC/YloC family endoribonuclease n=1 Tax=Marinospirillum sp. TaxID=2183934 RepID=UPI00286FCCA4|nr:YicC/YloC family endoribonuclease [Marinospirillum sp.]MDR9468058.1 YicC/YloC family endoribonuclease [Marinospirillum sp.]